MKLMYSKNQIKEAKSRYAELLKPAKKKGTYICPLCDNGTGKNGDGLAVYKGTQLKCFKGECGFAGDIFDLYEQAYNLDTKEAMNRVMNDLNIQPQSSTEPTAATRNEPKQQAPTEQQPEPETDFSVFYLQANKSISKTDYLQKRGISQATADKFKIGFVKDWRHPKSPKSPATPRVIIPITKFSYFVRDVRTNIPNSQIDYAKQLIKGTESPLWIFNYKALENSREPIFVVEGAIDALSFIEIGKRVVATLSTAFINGFIEYIKEHRPSQPLIIALDNDTAGKNSIEKLCEGLEQLGVIFYRIDPQDLYGDHKDANEALVSDRAGFTDNANRILFTVTQSDNIGDYVKYAMEQDIKEARERSRIYTGLENLDKATGGLYNGLYILAALPSLGKTTLAHQIADNIAFSGTDVLYFSLEMSRFELASKSIARLAAQRDINSARTALQIRQGALTQPIIQAAENYTAKVKNHLHIIQGDFDTNTRSVCEYTERFIKTHKTAPVVFVDYLQILDPGTEREGTKRNNVDDSIKALKQLSSKNNICVFVISSINRNNYSSPINFESLKESGGIEYGADVVFGLQLSIINEEDLFEKDEKKEAKRKRIKEEKEKVIRRLDLVCLKNRYGAIELKPAVHFDYNAAYDLFTPSSSTGKKKLSEYSASDFV